MTNGEFICPEHSGCMARIDNLEHGQDDQWTAIGDHDKNWRKALKEQDNRMNSIFTRINIILGGIIVACILMVINLIVGK